MKDYTASIEQQNDELKRKLGEAERKRDFYRKQFSKEWGMHIHSIHSGNQHRLLRVVTDYYLRIPWNCLLAAFERKELSGFTIWRMYGKTSKFGCRVLRNEKTNKFELHVFIGPVEYTDYVLSKEYKSLKKLINDVEKYLIVKRFLYDNSPKVSVSI